MLICLATIHRLPLANPDTAIYGLKTRYLNLVKMEDKLPSNDAIKTPESLDFDEIVLALPTGFTDPEKPVGTTVSQPESQLEPQTEAQPETPKPDGENQETAPQSQEKPQNTTVNRAAFALALFGWDIISEGAAGLAGCGACFRRLGLWMYKPKDNGEIRVYDGLEVANEHMEYCPWISGQAQSGAGKPTDKPESLHNGWEVLSQALKVHHRRRIRSTASMDTLRAGSETPSIADGPVVDEGVDEEKKKATDREWWSKIRRMKQVLNVKSPRRKSTAPGK